MLSLQYNNAIKQKNKTKQNKTHNSSDLWNQSQHFIFITNFSTTLDINKDFNGFFWPLNQRKDSTRRTLDFTIKNPKASLKVRVGHLFI